MLLEDTCDRAQLAAISKVVMSPYPRGLVMLSEVKARLAMDTLKDPMHIV